MNDALDNMYLRHQQKQQEEDSSEGVAPLPPTPAAAAGAESKPVSAKKRKRARLQGAYMNDLLAGSGSTGDPIYTLVHTTPLFHQGSCYYLLDVLDQLVFVRFFAKEIRARASAGVAISQRWRFRESQSRYRRSHYTVPQYVVADQSIDGRVRPISHRDVYENLGVSPPVGVLLHGPPGSLKNFEQKFLWGNNRILTLKKNLLIQRCEGSLFLHVLTLYHVVAVFSTYLTS